MYGVRKMEKEIRKVQGLFIYIEALLIIKVIEGSVDNCATLLSS